LIVAKNAMCRFHLDSTNRGSACILGVGGYTGGELLLNMGLSNTRLVRLTNVLGVGGAKSEQCGGGDDGEAVQAKE